MILLAWSTIIVLGNPDICELNLLASALDVSSSRMSKFGCAFLYCSKIGLNAAQCGQDFETIRMTLCFDATKCSPTDKDIVNAATAIMILIVIKIVVGVIFYM